MRPLEVCGLPEAGQAVVVLQQQAAYRGRCLVTAVTRSHLLLIAATAWLQQSPPGYSGHRLVTAVTAWLQRSPHRYSCHRLVTAVTVWLQRSLSGYSGHHFVTAVSPSYICNRLVTAIIVQ